VRIRGIFDFGSLTERLSYGKLPAPSEFASPIPPIEDFGSPARMPAGCCGGEDASMAGAVEVARAGRAAPYDAVRIALALLLLTAAGLKGYQLATEPVLGGGLLESRWFLIAVVEFEILFGLWLLSGLAPGWTWRAAVLCFGAFAAVSAYKGVAGEASCGCFGRVAVNPWYTFALDCAALALLAAFRPRSIPRPASCRWRLPAWACAALMAGVGVPAFLALGSYPAASIAGDGLVESGRVVVLMPEAWKGKRFPLFEHIDVGDRLSTGRWVVVLYHLGCPKCRELIEEYRQLPRESGANLPVAFVEVPEPRPGREHTPLDGLPSLQGQLIGSAEWFVPTPTIVLLQDGVVCEACGNGSGRVLSEMVGRHRLGQQPRSPFRKSANKASRGTLSETSPFSRRRSSAGRCEVWLHRVLMNTT
jgi:hypothetical protein